MNACTSITEMIAVINNLLVFFTVFEAFQTDGISNKNCLSVDRTGPFLLECRLPEKDTSISHEELFNLTLEEEMELRIEGRCFLACAEQESNRSEVNINCIELFIIRNVYIQQIKLLHTLLQRFAGRLMGSCMQS